MKIIELKNISKRIKQKDILVDINLSIEEGIVCGFSGPNGAGKSMIFNTIIGFAKPTEGEVWVNGKHIRVDELFSSSIAFSMDSIGMLEDFSVLKNLDLINQLNSHKMTKNELNEMVTYVGLDPNDKRAIKHYSLGMKKRASIACCLINDAPILILDEPSNALDDSGKDFLRQLIIDQKAAGKTILISNHDSVFLNEVSDKIIHISEGRVILK